MESGEEHGKMLKEEEYICPKCGAICDSLTAFHKHVEKEHDEPRKK